jgi:pimeloyl-ACP methyl ester carboxylesterase
MPPDVTGYSSIGRNQLSDPNNQDSQPGRNAGAEEGVEAVDQASDNQRSKEGAVMNMAEQPTPSGATDSDLTISPGTVGSESERLLGSTTPSKEGQGEVKGNLRGEESTGLEQDAKPVAGERPPLAPTRTNSLVPPAPDYGPPTFATRFKSVVYRCTSAVLSFWFLMFVVAGAIIKLVPRGLERFWMLITLTDHKKTRPFYEEEARRQEERYAADKAWRQSTTNSNATQTDGDLEKSPEEDFGFKPTEGGPDRLVPDISYYARRAGLDCEIFLVETEDGFVLELYHLYNPLTTSSTPESERNKLSPVLFDPEIEPSRTDLPSERQYPVLLIPGLLQSPGAYCCSGSSTSIAFFLAKSGFDVWLGSNRCGFEPRHICLSPSDPRFWSWTLRHMGVLDLPALTARVLQHTGFKTLALVAHSQGTAETLVALAKQQRPDFGKRISIACLLAPAAYAGVLLKRPLFRSLRLIPLSVFRVTFGVHSFIPFMQLMHRILPSKIYGALGYRVFNFLFDWSDERWERSIRDRFFLFSPTWVSAESMRWWLGSNGFAKEKCILQTKEQWKQEDQEDEAGNVQDLEQRGRLAWYDERVPPMALWVAGSDGLVDGRKLLRRFSNGREPYVKLVHSKVIEEYEHLDVIWAVDVIDQVGKEVLDCIWKTIPADARSMCTAPRGCVESDIWVPSKA